MSRRRGHGDERGSRGAVWRWRGERGGVTIEVVLLTPVLLALIAFVVFAGRIGQVSGQVRAAAEQAARTASLHGGVDGAVVAAEDTAAANLADDEVPCASVEVVVDTARFRRGGEVGVTVACQLEVGELVFAGLPGQRTVSASAREVIDTFRTEVSP